MMGFADQRFRTCGNMGNGISSSSGTGETISPRANISRAKMPSLSEDGFEGIEVALREYQAMPRLGTTRKSSSIERDDAGRDEVRGNEKICESSAFTGGACFPMLSPARVQAYKKSRN